VYDGILLIRGKRRSNMKRIVIVLLVSALTGCASSNKAPAPPQTTAHRHGEAHPAASKDSDWFAGLGSYTHPVSTTNAGAQRAFDEGLILLYGFNHDEAIRRFQRAAELDPGLAMAHWGVALAKGDNYNWDATPEEEKQAYEALQKAIALSKDAPQQEKDYIAALSKRYSNESNPDYKALGRAYAGAMRDLSRKYPDDLDAATLFADSMMVLRPWKLWTKTGQPEEGTEELVAALEYVLLRNPDHPGANHLYIHAVEASNHPERALEAAGRLPGLAPAAGPLVHMPSHIYQRVGDYEAASNSNVAAIEADEDYLSKVKPPDGMYNMMYYPHNIHFLAASRAQEGRGKEALEAGEKLHKYVGPMVPHMAALEGFMPMRDWVLVRFARWDDIMKLPEPDKAMPTTHALWRFARGMACAGKGRLDEASREHALLLEEAANIPTDHVFSMFNTSHAVLGIADKTLAARIAVSKGSVDEAVALLREAAKREDALNYTEPPDWINHTHEMLGGVLLRAKRYADAEQAFRADLKRNPRSGRSLYGLMQSLRGQGREYDAQMVEQQYKVAWRNAEAKLGVNDL
jgi:tetratricopeptide (TPR) repeat protein